MLNRVLYRLAFAKVTQTKVAQAFERVGWVVVTLCADTLFLRSAGKRFLHKRLEKKEGGIRTVRILFGNRHFRARFLNWIWTSGCLKGASEGEIIYG